MSQKSEKPATAAATTGENASDPVGQPTPAKPAQVRHDGLQIDGFGLPVNGVARSRILKELGSDDPLGGDDWTEAAAAKARKMTEKFYG